LIYFDIYAIVVLSLNLVVGYCGLLTLAHAGY
jgi:branched-chain amino acid transport system permease protein